MNLKTRFVSALVTIALANTLSLTSYAQQSSKAATNSSKQSTPAKPAVFERVARGSVVTMTDTSMVIRVKRGKDLTFAINPATEKIGDIGSGHQVTVHYRNEQGQHVATSIQEPAAPQAATAAKTKSK